jgi:hypothetical protein
VKGVARNVIDWAGFSHWICTVRRFCSLAGLLPVFDPFHVSQKNGKLYWSESGQSAVEAKPRKSSASEVEFSVDRSRVQFSKVDAKWDQVVLKTSAATLEAHRRK